MILIMILRINFKIKNIIKNCKKVIINFDNFYVISWNKNHVGNQDIKESTTNIISDYVMPHLP